MSFKLIDDPSVVIYDRNRVIIQATGLKFFVRNFEKGRQEIKEKDNIWDAKF